MSKKSVAVRIAGHQYKIRSDGDAETLQEIASYVDKAMDRVRARTGTVDTLDVAVLTCLNLAREILVLRDQQSGDVGDGRMRSLIERVEMVLDGDFFTGAQSVGESVGESRAENDLNDSNQEGEARTLDLPSVEVLHERASTASGSEASDTVAMPEARAAAAGGRERAS
jgi:cell division protein ZapA (FtsZ GTPase activity inhibitor)